MKSLSSFSLSLISAAVLLANQPAWADDQQLPEMVVTATRTPVTADATLAAVTVVTRDQIDNSSARDVGDLLRDYAGLDVVRSGGIGQATSVFLRGANSAQSLIMVDGVPINSGTFGGYNLQNIRPEDVDHIEVVKGPRSSLYGSDAIGGVINIITRNPGETATYAELGGANDHTAIGNLRQDVKDGNFSGSVNVGGIYTRGYPVFADATQNTGYKNSDAGAKFSYHADNLTLSGSYQRNTGTSQYLNGEPPFSPLTYASQDFINDLGVLQAKVNVNDRYTTTLRLSSARDGQNQNQIDTFDTPPAFDYAHTRREQIDWQNDFQVADNNLLTLGGTYENEHVSVLSFGTGYDRTLESFAGYIQDQWTQDQFSLQIADRFTHNGQYGDHDTGELALGWAFNTHNRAYATLSSGFHAPDGNDLYGFGGNPTLKPETSLNREIGTHHTLGAWDVQTGLFENDVKNLIETELVDPVNFIFQNQNIERSRLRGAELSVGYHQGGWSWINHASYIEPRDVQLDEDLPRRPRRNLSSALDYHWDRYNVGAEAVSNSQSINTAFDSPLIELPGVVVYNVHAGVKLTSYAKLKLSIDNLTDKTYGLAANGNLANGNTRYYLAQPRLVALTLDLKF